MYNNKREYLFSRNCKSNIKKIYVTINRLSQSFHLQQPRNVRSDAMNGKTSTLVQHEVTNQRSVTELICQ